MLNYLAHIYHTFNKKARCDPEDLIPILIIPQLLFSGVMVKFDKLNPIITSQYVVPVVGDMMASRWAFEALAVKQFKDNEFNKNLYKYDKALSIATYKKDYWLAEFAKKIAEIVTGKNKETDAAKLLTLLNSQNFEEFIFHLPASAQAHEGLAEIKTLLEKLEGLGITNVRFSQTLMRGFDYYTGIVFEVFDTNPENRRAVFGGGRYDDLLDIFGAEKIPAVGFGAGDVVIKDMLALRNLIPTSTAPADLYLVVLDEALTDHAQDFAKILRDQGVRVTVDYSGRKVGDQIKYADKQAIPFIIVIGEVEIRTGDFKLKNLKTGEEKLVKADTIAKLVK